VDSGSATTEDAPAEKEVNGHNEAEEENEEGHTEDSDEDSADSVDKAVEEETTLKRKDALTEVEEDSPKKKKLIDSDEKEPEAATAEA
jgi:hypothetical protein